MNFCKSTIVWSVVLIILSCSFDVDAAKASRRGGTKQKTPHYDPVHLSYGHGHTVKQKPVEQHQVHHTQTQQQQHPVAPNPPSAPALPSNNFNNNNKPIGWNVPQSHNTPEQPKTVSNTHSALPYPQNPPPPYTQHNQPVGGPPPAYSPNSNNAYNAHPGDHPPAYQQGSTYRKFFFEAIFYYINQFYCFYKRICVD